MKSITIIAPNSFGYLHYLIDELEAHPNVVVTHINFSDFRYVYSSKFDKIKNAVNKVIFNKNIKDKYKSKRILDFFLKKKEKEDYIVVIRPDEIELETLLKIKTHTNNFIAFYFDAIAKFPKKKNLIPIFDKVYSYEKEDVKNYNLEFITNYIYDFDKSKASSFENKVFNISSYDERFGTLKKVVKYLRNNNIEYNIIVRKEVVIEDEYITIVPDYLPLEEVKKHILNSEILLDIQKQNQKGLSFRVFEALGYNKKLITTNEDVKNYDFYNPNNILIISPNSIDIPESFLNSAYQNIEDSLLFPYTLEGWILKVFSI
ncbi:hypothetical protein FEZ18_00520 [Oceanihabitans sp. IOP_32]|uniref:hypothetical protein n=1 Tax=Oceanihabitans sp. IOP_32 TaxID=2529032 RepID=UPI0012940527|nr:hypothetical protein [Oceanihabitans sp. IOP_32]QFZ53395.1 hypothetical protein FEZ18_00520 [Oceanihabitans sp. IOP_32]